MRFFLLPATVICLSLLPNIASANTLYFIQLGSAATESQAEEKWETLRNKNSAMLDNLTFYPRSVFTDADSQDEFRIQAGPVESKDKAEDICRKLRVSNNDCFIVETPASESRPVMPEVTFATTEQESETPATPDDEDTLKPELPAIVSKFDTTDSSSDEGEMELAEQRVQALNLAQSENSDAKPSNFVELPWLKNTPETLVFTASPSALPLMDEVPASSTLEEEYLPAELAEPAPDSTKNYTGEVEVAEAIPVIPGTETLPPEAMEVELLETTEDGDALRVESVPSQNIWLEIRSFINDNAAREFGDHLRNEIPGSGSLRLRTSHSYSRLRQNNAILQVGPVSTQEAAERICSFTQSFDQQLECITLQPEITKNTSLTALSSPYARGRYLPERTAPPRKSDGRTSYNGSAALQAKAPDSIYYIQLGSWPSRATAKRRWSRLLSRHREILGNETPHYTAPRYASASAGNTIRLRTGPYPERSRAETLCQQLVRASVSCLVVSE